MIQFLGLYNAGDWMYIGGSCAWHVHENHFPVPVFFGACRSGRSFDECYSGRSVEP